ncbi:MAG TPA: site-specific integrase [Stellaceae bacterium]|jgi:integrase|nr:site-specific integrase [Stellaceae bacterium]
MLEKIMKFPVCNPMSNTVSRAARNQPAHAGSRSDAASLYAVSGGRKYLNQSERQRSLAGMEELPNEQKLFAQTLAWTGARVSEVLALTAASFQVKAGIVGIVTLKRRRFAVREVPIPPALMADLDAHFGLRASRNSPRMLDRLWNFCRTTAWRVIKRIMKTAGISGRHACPKAFRHAFGIGTLQSGVPMNLTQRWLGHASVRTTAIYADAAGPEEIAFAQRFWRPPSGEARHDQVTAA